MEYDALIDDVAYSDCVVNSDWYDALAHEDDSELLAVAFSAYDAVIAFDDVVEYDA
jgi:hypothetical protein